MPNMRIHLTVDLTTNCCLDIILDIMSKGSHVSKVTVCVQIKHLYTWNIDVIYLSRLHIFIGNPIFISLWSGFPISAQKGKKFYQNEFFLCVFQVSQKKQKWGCYLFWVFHIYITVKASIVPDWMGKCSVIHLHRASKVQECYISIKPHWFYCFSGIALLSCCESESLHYIVSSVIPVA